MYRSRICKWHENRRIEKQTNKLNRRIKKKNSNTEEQRNRQTEKSGTD